MTFTNKYVQMMFLPSMYNIVKELMILHIPQSDFIGRTPPTLGQAEYPSFSPTGTLIKFFISRAHIKLRSLVAL